jgi:uncharacterized protein YjeT (DUF2065 family)
MVEGIERLTALVFLLMGLSHALQPKAWARFFIELGGRGVAAGIWNAYLHAPLGLLIVSFHNLWTWPELLVTLIGWSLTLKGAVYFCAPQLAPAAMSRITPEGAGMYRVAGIASMALGLAVAWIALT